MAKTTQEFLTKIHVQTDMELGNVLKQAQTLQKALSNINPNVKATSQYQEISKLIGKIQQSQSKMSKMGTAGLGNSKDLKAYEAESQKVVDYFQEIVNLSTRINNNQVHVFDNATIEKARNAMNELQTKYETLKKEMSDSIKLSIVSQLGKASNELNQMTLNENNYVAAINKEVEARKKAIGLSTNKKITQAQNTALSAVSDANVNNSLTNALSKQTANVKMAYKNAFAINNNKEGGTLSLANVSTAIRNALSQALKTNISGDSTLLYKDMANIISKKNNATNGNFQITSSTAFINFMSQLEATAPEFEAAIKRWSTEINTATTAEEKNILALQEHATAATQNASKIANQKSGAVNAAGAAATAAKNTYTTLSNSNDVKSQEAITAQIEKQQTALSGLQARYKSNNDQLTKAAGLQTKWNNALQSTIGYATQMFGIYNIYFKINSIIRQTWNTTKELDKAFSQIAMVTDFNLNDLWGQYDQYVNMAQELGQNTQSVIEASALFYQQGLKTEEVMAATRQSMILATLSGEDYSTATSQLTAAMRAYNIEAENSQHITDAWSELAAKAAADVQGIATAFSKVGSLANSAGMDFDTLSAYLTETIETTQESAENIGTAMKTIIARFTELKTNVAGTSESEFEDLDYNNVDKALKGIGINMKDTNGQFKDMSDIFLELNAKWDGLDRNTQRYIATTAAGSRRT